MSSFIIKTGDTLPALEAVLSNSLGPVDLTAASAVKLVLREAGNDGDLVFKKAAAFVSPRTAGTVKYSWASGDTATPGRYVGEFEVTFNDGTIQTFPTADKFPVTMVADNDYEEA